MPIVYSAVASERNIVSNFASCDGNFTEIAEQVLSKLPPCNNKMTYSHGVYLLHYIAENDYLYFCITDKLCQRSRAFLFLNEIQRRFSTSKQTEDFTTTLAAEMYRYSEDYSTIVIRKGELDELNTIGVGCSETLLGEKILYINNPDIISYSTISHVKATPGLISVSGVSPTSEELVVVTTTEKTSVLRPTPERSPGKATSEENIVSPRLQNMSVVSDDRISTVNASPEQVSVQTTPDRTTISQNISVVFPNQERISSASPIFNSTLIMSPRLYVVIVGMIVLVIAMSVCALGPISCVVVTCVGMYSLLRSFKRTKDKSE